METITKYLKNYFKQNTKALENSYPGLSFNRLLREYLNFTGQNEDELALNISIPFISKIENSIPLEYINNEAYFYTSSFFVDERVLIPRNETEILVENTIEKINKSPKRTIDICEVGVGSGAIFLSILEHSKKKLNFIVTDICEDALKVAMINYFRHSNKISKEHSVSFQLSDKLESIKGNFDFIVSNPPYIKKDGDKEGVHFQANEFEPHKALYLPDIGHDKWFETFFKQASNRLNSAGEFLMEGHEDNLFQLRESAKMFFIEVLIINDYTRRPRFIYCKK